MKKQKELILVLTVVVALVATGLFLPGVVCAGDLEPPAGPDDDASAMYTIEDLYDYLDTGVAGTRRTGGFAEPVSGPGSTGRTLDEVHARITEKCITCPAPGTLPAGDRWCDQGNGTVKDMTTGLVWLKDAAWGGEYAFWVNTINGTNAHDRAAQVKDGTPATLTDGSVEGDWRLPTKEELYGLTHGTEAVRSGTPRAFTGVQSDRYWSSTTYASGTYTAWGVNVGTGVVYGNGKHYDYYVWPVRSGN
jgi:hypothetical protein